MFKLKLKKFQMPYLLIWAWDFIVILQSSLWGNDSEVSADLFKIILLLRICFVLYVLYKATHKCIKKILLLKLMAFTCVTVFEYFLSNSWLLFDCFFVALFIGESLDYNRLLKTYFSATLSAFITTVVLSTIGVWPTYSYSSDRVSALRSSFGFRHPTVLGETILIITVLVFLLYYEKNRKKVSLGIILVAIFLYIVPNSLTATASAICLLLIRHLLELVSKLRAWEKCKRNVYGITIAVGAACFVLSYLLLFNTNLDQLALFSNFETLMSRVRMGRLAFLRYGLTAFGTAFQVVGASNIAVYGATASSYFTLDCMYYNLPIRCGVVGTAAFFLVVYALLKRSVDSKKLDIISVIIVLFLDSLSCGGLSTLGFNFVFICQMCNREINTLKK